MWPSQVLRTSRLLLALLAPFLWGKPAAVSWGHQTPLWREPRGRTLRPSATSHVSASSWKRIFQPRSNLQTTVAMPPDVLIISSWGPWARTIQGICSWVPDPQKLLSHSKSVLAAKFGDICYAAVTNTCWEGKSLKLSKEMIKVNREMLPGSSFCFSARKNFLQWGEPTMG